jgi:hypothetical protein
MAQVAERLAEACGHTSHAFWRCHRGRVSCRQNSNRSSQATSVYSYIHAGHGNDAPVPQVRLASRDRRRDALDKLIAAHALALDLTLVTNNPRDFADYAALRIENWVE